MKTLSKTFFAALAALAALPGCRHVEQEFPEASGRRPVQFRAVAADTRTAFTEPVDGVYQTLWTENDREILLSLNYGEAESAAVNAAADGRTATFEAAFDAASAPSPYTFYAVSPASAARAISPSRSAWSVYIAAEQTPSALSVDEGAQLLVAKSAASTEFPPQVDLHFSHLTAYGRISLQNLDLGEAKVRKVDLVFDTPVVGEWYWGEDGNLTSNGASHTITLNTDASGDLWFACAPVSVGGTGMTINLYTSAGFLSKTITFPEGRSFSSGKVARFSIDMTGVVPEASDHFTLVTDTAELTPGTEVVFLNASGTVAMGVPTSDGLARKAVSGGFALLGTGLDVFVPDVSVFTVVDGFVPGRSWSFLDEYGYLASLDNDDEDKTFIVSSPELDKYSSWVFSFESDGTVDAQTVGGSVGHLRYQASRSRFTCFSYWNTEEMVKIYRKNKDAEDFGGDDPMTGFTEYGCYLRGNRRTYVRGADQFLRLYDADGKVRFILLNEGKTEQLVISGYDPSLRKGDKVTLNVTHRIGDAVLQERETTLSVVKEDGPKVWLGDGTGQGIILKK